MGVLGDRADCIVGGFKGEGLHHCDRLGKPLRLRLQAASEAAMVRLPASRPSGRRRRAFF